MMNIFPRSIARSAFKKTLDFERITAPGFPTEHGVWQKATITHREIQGAVKIPVETVHQ
jgi:hypothetical protein